MNISHFQQKFMTYGKCMTDRQFNEKNYSFYQRKPSIIYIERHAWWEMHLILYVLYMVGMIGFCCQKRKFLFDLSISKCVYLLCIVWVSEYSVYMFIVRFRLFLWCLCHQNLFISKCVHLWFACFSCFYYYVTVSVTYSTFKRHKNYINCLLIKMIIG